MKSISAVIAMLFVTLFSQPLMAVENASWGEVKFLVAEAPAGKLVVSANAVAGTRERRIDKRPSITVLSPNGGESWPIGSIQKIEWSSRNVNKVSFWLCESGTCGRLATMPVSEADITSTGSYSFPFVVSTDIVPFGAYVPSSSLKIRVASEDCYPTSTIYDDSDASFSVVEDRKIFNAPVVEFIQSENPDYSNIGGTRPIFKFKVSAPSSTHYEWAELTSCVFKVMGAGVYPSSLRLMAFDDADMTVTTGGWNQYIQVKKYDLVGGFLSVVEPDMPVSLPVTVLPGRTRYFILFADVDGLQAKDNIEVSLVEANFKVLRPGQ